MATIPINPPGTDPALGYTHGMLVEGGGGRTLYVSGQVGTAPDGTVPADFAAQAENAWRNLDATLRAAGMGLGDIVKLGVYLTSADDLAAFRTVRSRFVTHKPASTLVIVAALASPGWKVEVEAVAATS